MPGFSAKRATALLVVVVACAGCSGTGRGALPDQAAQRGEGIGQERFTGQYPIKAIATAGMVADLVRMVGEEHVEVIQLLGAGVDPHLYRATRDDVRTI
ncbi:MAG: metal ABC transporter solute-binding protein, Zn/Mn family, partial [Thermoguttaceae bacterium]